MGDALRFFLIRSTGVRGRCDPPEKCTIAAISIAKNVLQENAIGCNMITDRLELFQNFYGLTNTNYNHFGSNYWVTDTDLAFQFRK